MSRMYLGYLATVTCIPAVKGLQDTCSGPSPYYSVYAPVVGVLSSRFGQCVFYPLRTSMRRLLLMCLTPQLLPIPSSYSDPTVAQLPLLKLATCVLGPIAVGNPQATNWPRTVYLPMWLGLRPGNGPVLGRPRAVPLATQPITVGCQPRAKQAPPNPQRARPH